MLKNKWPNHSFGDGRLHIFMETSSIEGLDLIWNGKAVEWRPTGQTNRVSSFLPSFDRSVRQMEDSKPKAEGMMDNNLGWCILKFSTKHFNNYIFSQRHTQYLAFRQLVSCCCYFVWCNRVILPIGAMVKVRWEWPDEDKHVILIHAFSISPL